MFHTGSGIGQLKHTGNMVRTVFTGAVKSDNSRYEEAVKALNTLQSNAQTIEKIRQDRDKNAPLNIPKMLNFAARAGIKEADMDRLNVIHVSGTKGKGSTCAFCESILRHHGYKTGFFSSPHLVEVRERFCVDGSPLERDKFATYFWDVYNKLESSKASNDGLMPNYFGFLTVMALHVFLQEEVDVAVMEVGIGGQYDSTNLVRNPVVCGVTSLGLDHTSILGQTVDKIAWHKAGIFKPSVPAFTIPQAPEAMDVLKERAIEIGTSLSLCPDISSYGEGVKLGIKGTVQRLNASLAIQLCNTWMKKDQENVKKDRDFDERNCRTSDNPSSDCDIKTALPVNLTTQYYKGLEECQWLGRNQTIKEPGLTYYLDGAHTVESIQQCVGWFTTESVQEEQQSKDGVYRVLIFNTTGDRETSSLIKPLLSCKFDAVLFCPNIAYEKGTSADQTNNTVTKESQLKRCLNNRDMYEKLAREEFPPNIGRSDPHLARLDEHHHQSAGGLSNGFINRANGHLNDDSVVKQTKDIEGSISDGHEKMSKNEIGCYNVNDLELHAFPSISDCVNWVCKRQWGKQINPEKEVEFNNSQKRLKLESNSKHLCDQENDEWTNGHQNIGNEDNIMDKNELEAHKGDKSQVQVLITGSIHLVGGALRVIWDKQL